MFIGVNTTTRRRILREALTLQLELIKAKDRDAVTQTDVDDMDQINSMLREINAAENLGKPVGPGMSTHPTHYGDR